MNKETILTGIRSNDSPHLGNYLGAIQPMIQSAIKYSKTHCINMFVPDLHSFTTPTEYDSLFDRTLQNIKLYVACGLPIEHENVNIYRQSYVPAHSEMAWILGCFTGFGEANRMVEFKDKSSQLGDDRVSVGLFNYPILMASDILLYDAKWIPVGEDQRQHLELTRTLAQRLNNQFGEIFTVPNDTKSQQKFIDRDSSLRIMSLKHPDKKMSKSINDPAGTILLNDTPSDAAKKVMAATTDSVGVISLDWENQPGISNLLCISALLSEKPIEEVAKAMTGKTNYGELKSIVAGQVEEFLTNLQTKMKNLDDSKILGHLEAGEKSMNIIANKKLLQIQKAIGLRK